MASFIVISGIPGSGKSTVGARLATSLQWKLVDKDVQLERLFDDRWDAESLIAQSERLEVEIPLGLGDVVEYDSSGAGDVQALISRARVWAEGS